MSATSFKPQLPRIGGVPILPGRSGCRPYTQGDLWHVRPHGGDDGNVGKKPAEAFASLAYLLSKMTANQNDEAIMYAENHDTTAYTTDYQAAGLNWNKDLTEVRGSHNGSFLSQRSRIAFDSDYDGVGPLMTISADACRFKGLQWFMGLTSIQPLGALKVTGNRNVIEDSHIAGIGAATNDIAGAYSLLLDGAQETVIRRCAIGLDTIVAGAAAANSEILIDGGTSRTLIEDCLIYRMIGHATNHPLVKLADATAIDRWLWFRRCMFLSMSVNYQFTQTGTFAVPALTQGYVLLEDCKHNGTKWDVNDNDKILIWNTAIPPADTAGTPRAV